MIYDQIVKELRQAYGQKVEERSKRDLYKVLRVIRDLLQPGGFFYWGQYGGIEKEGTWSEDHYEPKRFFCLLLDEEIKEMATSKFELVSFRRIDLEGESDIHFQSMVLKRD